MARVLVVDDEPDVRAALTMLLEDDGHSVIQLDDGHAVLEIAAEHGVDLILLDLSMPQIDGFEVLSMLKLEPRAASVPVLIISARGRPNDKAQAMALGAVDYVNKPWADGEIEFRVRMALGRAERRWAEETRRSREDEKPGATPWRPAEPSPPTRPAPPQKSSARRPLPRQVRRRPRIRRVVRRVRRAA